MYIGNTPAENYASFLTETFSVSATASYTLSHAVTNENDIRLVINGVVQQPGSGKAYTASGTTLTLTSATVSGDVMYAVYLGRALQTVNPPNASVGTAQLADSSVTSAKLSGVTEGVTVADQWRLTSSFSGDADPIASNLSRISGYGAGQLGSGMTESSGIFTFPSTGIYQIIYTLRCEMGTGYRHQMNLKTTIDNSSYNVAAFIRVNASATQGDNQATATQTFLFDVTNTSLCKCQFQIVDESASDNNITGGSSTANLTCMSFIRLGNT